MTGKITRLQHLISKLQKMPCSLILDWNSLFAQNAGMAEFTGTAVQAEIIS